MTELTESIKNEDEAKKQQDWIKYPIEKAEIIRKETKKTGEDTDTILLGHIITLILDDDANAFNMVKLSGYSPHYMEYSRTVMLGRLSLEIEFKETPEELRKQLELTRNKLQEHDWIGEKGFNEVFGIWKETVRDWTQNFRDTNPEINEAYEKFQAFNTSLSKAFPKRV
ncbi:hypothetical protein KKH23_01435 [Patescibacteria group bacterium]|nr:hypothetical protein [Patescibacteria group bacterium]MBU0777154.1 hypothetical protein [Patescibacteria group bacterium]MBU0845848.1 hypothetical protein [Patescibacteria group bacterium]MBU0922875.1 hypothetical protein [Patescibacteria group bacterium]MBU1066392.1 hypothetical protein [Patescibacteria group bacterium]